MTDLVIPDFNEFHRIEGYQGPTILRALYNTTADRGWADGDAQKAAGQSWWMPYVYVSAAADPAACARALKAQLQRLGIHPNAISGDFEEGAGDQSAREAAFDNEMADLQIAELDYSGLSFKRTHLAAGNIKWIAAYGQGEPSDAHTLWQYTDKQWFPGVSAPCDASIFHGTLDDLIRLTSPTVPAPTPHQEEVMRVFEVRIPQPGDLTYDGQPVNPKTVFVASPSGTAPFPVDSHAAARDTAHDLGWELAAPPRLAGIEANGPDVHQETKPVWLISATDAKTKFGFK